MLIKKIAFGNLEEAFIEERLTDGVNIIYSDENNKGKTLLFQAFMYSIWKKQKITKQEKILIIKI